MTSTPSNASCARDVLESCLLKHQLPWCDERDGPMYKCGNKIFILNSWWHLLTNHIKAASLSLWCVFFGPYILYYLFIAFLFITWGFLGRLFKFIYPNDKKSFFNFRSWNFENWPFINWWIQLTVNVKVEVHFHIYFVLYRVQTRIHIIYLYSTGCSIRKVVLRNEFFSHCRLDVMNTGWIWFLF